MAKINLSSLLSHIGGSVGSSTFQNTKHGYIVRNKPIPRNPETSSQLLNRNIFAQLSIAWANADQTTRNYYENAYKTSVWKGEMSKKAVTSARQLFIAFNYFRLYNNYTLLTSFTAPISYSFRPQLFVAVESGKLLFWSYPIGASDENNIMFNVYVSALFPAADYLRTNKVPTRQILVTRFALNKFHTVKNVSEIYPQYVTDTYEIYFEIFITQRNYPYSYPVYAGWQGISDF